MSSSSRQLVIHGQVVTGIDQFPYFAMVGDYCGGSLIAPDVVLTAGHCQTHHEQTIRIHPASRSQIRHIYHSVLQVRHPDFDWRGEDDFSNDFLIIRLSEAVVDHPIVRLSKEPVGSRDIIAMGMGWTDRFRPSRAERLRTVELTTIPNAVCEASRGRNMTYQGRIDDSMMCTTGGPDNERDTCNCDSGSPLILPGIHFDTIVGMVSWGMECADPDFPAVNARISSAYEWIRGTTCGLSRYPPSYLCGNRQESMIWLYGLGGVILAGYSARKLWMAYGRGSVKQRYSSVADASVVMA